MEKTGEYCKGNSPCAACGRPSAKQADNHLLCKGCFGADKAHKSASHPSESIDQAATRLGIEIESLTDKHNK